MEEDARYVDITPQLNMMGGTWSDIVAFMNLKSMHPLKPTLKAYLGHVNSEMDALLHKISGDIVIFNMRTDIPYMHVHVGVLDSMVKIFRLTMYHPDKEYLKIINLINVKSSKLPISACCTDFDRMHSHYQEAIAICLATTDKLEDHSEDAHLERRSFFFQDLEKVQLITNVLRTELEIRRTAAVAELSSRR